MSGKIAARSFNSNVFFVKFGTFLEDIRPFTKDIPRLGINSGPCSQIFQWKIMLVPHFFLSSLRIFQGSQTSCLPFVTY
jgi:hypothetical protein